MKGGLWVFGSEHVSIRRGEADMKFIIELLYELDVRAQIALRVTLRFCFPRGKMHKAKQALFLPRFIFCEPHFAEHWACEADNEIGFVVTQCACTVEQKAAR
jgi:hypothetical protein